MIGDTNKGILLQMQDYSIHDGDGVRTTIFLAGCPLRCKWCANPESHTTEPKLVYYKHKCKDCGKCAAVCPQGLSPTTMQRPNPVCDVCGLCAEACPAKALAVACTAHDIEQIVARIKRDAIFFRFTGGGVTFSGGEPFVQADFLRMLANKFFSLGIGMWVETCGYFDFDAVKDILELLDHVFIDIKHMDSATHAQCTGVGNELILANAVKIYEMNIPVTVRIPSISGLNLTTENIEATAAFMAEHMPGAEIELLPYHELGKAKYIALGREADFTSFTTPTQEALDAAYAVFTAHNIKIGEYS